MNFHETPASKGLSIPQDLNLKKHSSEHFLCWMSQAFSMILSFSGDPCICNLACSAFPPPTLSSWHFLHLKYPQLQPLPINLTVQVGYHQQCDPITLSPSLDSTGICRANVLSGYFPLVTTNLSYLLQLYHTSLKEQGPGYIHSAPSCVEPGM